MDWNTRFSGTLAHDVFFYAQNFYFSVWDQVAVKRMKASKVYPFNWTMSRKMQKVQNTPIEYETQSAKNIKNILKQTVILQRRETD